MAIRYEEPLPWRALRWMIQERTGWTLEYIDSLDMVTVADALAVWRGETEGKKP